MHNVHNLQQLKRDELTRTPSYFGYVYTDVIGW